MKKTSVPFVTCEKYPGISADDQLIAEELWKLGIVAFSLPWTSTNVAWSNVGAMLIRSCWDYHLNTPAFLRWLDQIGRAEVRLFNPAETIRWNVHKKYLVELGRRGIRVPETVFLEKGTSVDLKTLMKMRGWQRAVIKPSVSASANKTWVTTDATTAADSAVLNRLLSVEDYMVQAFIEEICTTGEVSFIFIDRKFSHAVQKKPAKGDFRVQEAFGGTAAKYVPTPAVIKQAEDVMRAVDGDLLYARVDAVLTANGFSLMELELIEPVLFIRHAAKAASTFANSLAKKVGHQLKIAY